MGEDKSHLSQRQLREIQGIDGVLDELGRWLAKADFGDEKKLVQVCEDEGLPKASHLLLRAIGYEQEVVTISKIL